MIKKEIEDIHLLKVTSPDCNTIKTQFLCVQKQQHQLIINLIRSVPRFYYSLTLIERPLLLSPQFRSSLISMLQKPKTPIIPLRARAPLKRTLWTTPLQGLYHNFTSTVISQLSTNSLQHMKILPSIDLWLWTQTFSK